MKPPPLLIGAGLLFWGWQTGLLIPAAVMAVVLEAPRLVKLRWDFSEEDFSRIWIFCTLLFFASMVYAFTSNEGPSHFRNLFQAPTLSAQRGAGLAATHTAAALFRWLPMVFFLFAAAQAYSASGGVPVETVSLLLRWRWRRARKPGDPASSGQSVDVSYYYFALCLFAASLPRSDSWRTSDIPAFFWGFSALLAWALWRRRSTRFGPVLWCACLGLVVGVGYYGQQGLAQLQGYLGNLNLGFAGGGRGRHDPAQSRTDIGRIGRIKTSTKIVIRLEAQVGAAPPLLREASYRRFNGQTWFADVKDTDFITVLEDPHNSGNYNLILGKTNSLRVKIGCYLENGSDLLPLPSGVGRLENLSANALARSPLGAVLEEGPGVVVFDALYGPGGTLDSSYDETEDFAIPSREETALDETIARLDLPTQTQQGQTISAGSQQAALRALNKYFADHFSYSTYQPRQPRLKEDETPLSRFLLRTHRGHCEYFASAGVLLLRRLHIPARYAVGYAVHEGSAGKFVVRQRDAHAWCLYWDETRQSWRDLDFTPASWLQVEGVRQSWLQSLSDSWSRIRFELSKFRWGQTQLRQYLLMAVVPILLLLLFQIVFKSRRRRRLGKATQGPKPVAWPGLDSEFYRLEHALSRTGIARYPSETLSDWLERLCQDSSMREFRKTLQNLLYLHYRYRFDPQGLADEERQMLRTDVAALLERLQTEQPA